MRKAVIIGFFLLPFVASAQTAIFVRNLKVGDRGTDVVQLQKLLNQDLETRIAYSGSGSPGHETDYFGLLTKAAVMKFQNKYRAEVLYPVNLSAPSGYVGAQTRAKLILLSLAKTSSVVASPLPATTTAPAVITTTTLNKPIVRSVSPNKVRRGDPVTVFGENFSKTGNTVIIATGLLWQKFENLPSSDGKTITFVYKPPVPDEMTEADVRALPAEVVGQLEQTFTQAGGKLSDIWTPYGGIHSEAEQKAFLERNGRSFDEMYYHFWLNVRNANGEGETSGPLLYGLRAFPFEITASTPSPSFFSRLGEKLSEFVGTFFPLANAADYGGGLNIGKMMSCDCSDGYLTFQISYGGTGMGTFMYYYSSNFRPIVGSAKTINQWLGPYTTLGAPVSCWKEADIICFPIPANEPKKDIGFSLWPDWF